MADNVTSQESGDKDAGEPKYPVFPIGIDDPLVYEAFHPAGPGDANKSPSPFRVAGQVIEDAVQGAAKSVVDEAKNHPGRFTLEAGGAIALGIVATAGSPIIASGAALVGAGEAVVAGVATVGTAIEGIAATTLGIGTIGGGVAAVNDIKDGLNKSQKDIEIVTSPEKYTPQEIAQANKNIEANLGPGALEAILTTSGIAVAGGNAVRLASELTIGDKMLTASIRNTRQETLRPMFENDKPEAKGAEGQTGVKLNFVLDDRHLAATTLRGSSIERTQVVSDHQAVNDFLRHAQSLDGTALDFLRRGLPHNIFVNDQITASNLGVRADHLIEQIMTHSSFAEMRDKLNIRTTNDIADVLDPGRYSKSSGVDQQIITAFLNKTWELDPEAFQLLNYLHDLPTTLSSNQRITFTELGSRTDQLLGQMMTNPNFAIIKSDTERSIAQLQEEWSRNYSQTFGILSELTGTPLDREFPVHVSHPSVRSGANHDDTIFWSYRQDWPNYNTVYLWHEALHSLLPYGDHPNDIVHATIELLTDNELRCRLNGGSYPPFEGHPHLLKAKEQLLPLWQQYLSSSSKNIYRFLEQAQDAQEQKP